MPPLPKVAVLVGSKGRGSNMANLIEAGQSRRMQAQVALVVSPKAETPAVLRAQNLSTKVAVLSPRAPDYADRLLQTLKDHQIDLVCLAGYMTLLPKAVLDNFPNRVLNIHPALLPKFGGKGMYGHFVHEAVLAAHESKSGCTVHYVTEHYDEGAIITQEEVDVLPDDSPVTLAARVNAAEMIAYPRAVDLALQA